MTTLEKINQLKEQLLQEILDSDLTKIEKLKQIDDSQLFGINCYIQHIFSEQEEKLENLVKEKTGQKWAIVDDFFHDGEYERYRTINLYEILKSYFEDKENFEKITIATNRSTEDIIEVTYEEFEDIIYNWCISNKMIGFIMDW
jgi:hypothetical protein